MQADRQMRNLNPMRFLRRDNSTSEPASAPGEQSHVGELLDLASARISDIAAATDRASTEIKGKLAAAPQEGSASSRDRLVAELTVSLVDRTEQLGQEAAELSALLGRARTQIESSAPTPDLPALGPSAAPPADPADRASSENPFSVGESSVEPPSSGPVPDPEPSDEVAKGTTDAGAAIDQQVSDRFYEPASGQAMPFRPRKTAPLDEPHALNGSSTDGIRLLATQMAVAGSSREEIEARLRSEFDVEDASEILAEALSPQIGTRRVAG